MNKQILLVDDDQIWAETASRVLRVAGLDVHVAPDYRLALRILESEQPIDMLVTDIVMPQRVNGVALARMARMRRPGLPIIYITGYDIPGLQAETHGTVLRKPVGDERLLQEVTRLLAA